jgi:metal transporter CNNM
MVEGALKMKTLVAMDIFTPYKHVYSVPDDLILSQANITMIYSHGYSRVPVYHRNRSDPNDRSAVMGFLITRQLMLIDWDDNRELSTLPLQRPKCVSPRINLVDLLELLQTQGPLLTFVCARPDLANKALAAELPIPVEAGFMGIVTFVDIMESILQDRIYDESDIRDRDRAIATLNRWAATTLQSFLQKSTQRQKRRRSTLVAPRTPEDETTPLLSTGSSYAYGQNGSGEFEDSCV